MHRVPSERRLERRWQQPHRLRGGRERLDNVGRDGVGERGGQRDARRPDGAAVAELVEEAPLAHGLGVRHVESPAGGVGGGRPQRELGGEGDILHKGEVDELVVGKVR